MDGREQRNVRVCVDIYPNVKMGLPDIKVISSDGKSFPLHRGNILAYSGGFPLPSITPSSRPRVTAVKLPEHSRVLEVVLEYFYPKRYPDLEDKEFHDLVTIAGAVEKYKIYAAMHTCTSRLRQFMKDHPVEILSHSMKYAHPMLINEAASYLLFSPVTEVVEKLTYSDMILPWLQYRDATRKAIFVVPKVLTRKIPGAEKCSRSGAREASLYRCISPGCRNALTAWIAYLEDITTRAAFEEELDEPTQLSNQDCSSSGNGTCFWEGCFTAILRVGLREASSMDLTDFVQRANK